MEETEWDAWKRKGSGSTGNLATGRSGHNNKKRVCADSEGNLEKRKVKSGRKRVKEGMRNGEE